MIEKKIVTMYEGPFLRGPKNQLADPFKIGKYFRYNVLRAVYLRGPKMTLRAG